MKRFFLYASYLALVSLLFSLNGCFLFPEPKEELPPITQTGANTFGFLLNGQVWLPKGSDGTPNLTSSYDPTFMGGHLLSHHIDIITVMIFSTSRFIWIIFQQ